MFIYALKHPETGVVRYIGKTKDVRRRLYSHFCVARHIDGTSVKKRCNWPLYRWIRKLQNAGLKPIVEIIEQCSGTGADEEKKHIAFARASGVLLLNLTDGGEGTSGWIPTPEQRRRMGDAMKRRWVQDYEGCILKYKVLENVKKAKAAQMAVPMSAETRQKHSRNGRGRKVPPEALKKWRRKTGFSAVKAAVMRSAEMRRGVPLSLEHREKLSKIRTGRKLSPEHVEKVASAHRGMKRPLDACINISKSLRKVSENDLKQLAELYGSGVPLAEICRILNRSHSCINANLRRMGIPYRVTGWEKRERSPNYYRGSLKFYQAEPTAVAG